MTGRLVNDKETGRSNGLNALFLLYSNRRNYFAGATGAAGAAGAGASGAGAAGTGVSTAASGFCSSAFLQPTTANDNVTKKSRDRKTAHIFFIDVSPPFNFSGLR
ncbi:MAG: hypothetical protein Q7I93_06070 [Syntrophales bacterium]|nr:hypothetical protein [Syntrophales bacterium]